MKKQKFLRFFFGEESLREARSFLVADALILVCAVVFIPFSNGSLFNKAKQVVTSYRVAYWEQKAQKEISEPLEGYVFTKFYHLVVADTKKDKAYYYGQQAAIFKGKNNYLLCYKENEKVKKLSFKKWSDGNSEGIIVEDGKIIRFSVIISPDKDGCEFDFLKNGAFCEYYFFRKV